MFVGLAGVLRLKDVANDRDVVAVGFPHFAKRSIGVIDGWYSCISVDVKGGHVWMPHYYAYKGAKPYDVKFVDFLSIAIVKPRELRYRSGSDFFKITGCAVED